MPGRENETKGVEDLMAIQTLKMSLSNFRNDQPFDFKRDLIASDLYKKARFKLKEIEASRDMPDKRHFLQKIFCPIDWSGMSLDVELKFANNLRALSIVPSDKLIKYWDARR